MCLPLLLSQVSLNAYHGSIAQSHGFEDAKNDGVARLHSFNGFVNVGLISCQLLHGGTAHQGNTPLINCDRVDAQDRQGAPDIEGRKEERLGCAHDEQVFQSGLLILRPEALAYAVDVAEVPDRCPESKGVKGEQEKHSFSVLLVLKVFLLDKLVYFVQLRQPRSLFLRERLCLLALLLVTFCHLFNI